MTTAYDWITVALFAGLVVMVLHRSIGTEVPGDNLWNYLPSVAGCVIANQLGNNGRHWLAWLVLAATCLYILYVHRPFQSSRDRS